MVVFTSGVDHRFKLAEAPDRKIDAIFLSTLLSGRKDDQRPMSDELDKVDCVKVEIEDI
jgi:hypothetical protein